MAAILRPGPAAAASSSSASKRAYDDDDDDDSSKRPIAAGSSAYASREAAAARTRMVWVATFCCAFDMNKKDLKNKQVSDIITTRVFATKDDAEAFVVDRFIEAMDNSTISFGNETMYSDDLFPGVVSLDQVKAVWAKYKHKGGASLVVFGVEPTEVIAASPPLDAHRQLLDGESGDEY